MKNLLVIVIGLCFVIPFLEYILWLRLNDKFKELEKLVLMEHKVLKVLADEEIKRKEKENNELKALLEKEEKNERV